MEILQKDITLNEWMVGASIILRDKITPLVYQRYCDNYPYGQIPYEDFNILYALTWIQWAMQN